MRVHNPRASWGPQNGVVTLSPRAQALRRKLGDDVVARLLALVAGDLEGLAAELTDLYVAKIPAYARFDREVVEANTLTLIRAVVDQLADPDGRLGLDGVVEQGRAWANDRVPLEHVGQSLQLGARRVVQLLREHADLLQIRPDDLAVVQDLAWEWAIEGAAVLQALQRDVVAAGADLRADLVRRIVNGEVTPAELEERATTLGLATSSPYRVACVAADASGVFSDILASLRLHGSTHELPVVTALVDGMTVALLPRTPDQARLDAAIGLGPFAPLGAAAASFLEARRALQIAERHGLSGVFELTDLGPLILLDRAEEAGHELDARHLQPLRDLGPTGTDVIDTARCFLVLDRRIDDTARTLHLHRNSVRHRLTRFTEVSGLDLDRTDDLVLAWWLLRGDPGWTPGPRSERGVEP